VGMACQACCACWQGPLFTSRSGTACWHRQLGALLLLLLRVADCFRPVGPWARPDHTSQWWEAQEEAAGRVSTVVLQQILQSHVSWNEGEGLAVHRWLRGPEGA
jgi:hypothetical protein